MKKNILTIAIITVIVLGFVAIYDYEFVLSILGICAIVGLIALTVAEIKYGYENLKPKKKNKKSV
jgi:FtsH-binding integral membrane protein